MSFSTLRLYFSTLTRLKFSQLFFQLVWRFRSKARPNVRSFPQKVRDVDLTIRSLDFSSAWLDRFDLERIKDGKVRLLRQDVELDYSESTRKRLSPLCWFNLLYFEYAVALGSTFCSTGELEYANVFEKTYRKFLCSNLPLYPYVVSLHIVNVLVSLRLFGKNLGEVFRGQILQEFYVQYVFLSKHLEKHLLGNHYFENLKTLVIASFVFGKDRECAKYVKLFCKELDEEILADGVHFELSPMYHKIVLEDLLRVYRTTEEQDFPDRVVFRQYLKKKIQSILNAAVSLEKGIGRTPLFNDSGDNVAKGLSELVDAAREVVGVEPQYDEALPNAGYYKLYDDEIAVIFDAGKIGADYIPGHGVCDCLSFELSLDSVPLFVNAGTYQYQGDRRSYFRSTRSRNTSTINGVEQSECWGEHRAARRIRDVKAARVDGRIRGEYANYRGDRHIRTISLLNRRFTVVDEFDAREGALIQSYLHIAPGFSVERVDSSKTRVVDDADKEICMITSENSEIVLHTVGELCDYAPEFGLLSRGLCLEFRYRHDGKSRKYTFTFNDRRGRHD